jgi:hypothetical protein
MAFGEHAARSWLEGGGLGACLDEAVSDGGEEGEGGVEVCVVVAGGVADGGRPLVPHQGGVGAAVFCRADARRELRRGDGCFVTSPA